MAQDINFVALGSVWLDEIQHEGQDPIRDVVGGSLTYATLGARMFLSHDPHSIGMVLNAGHDFPEHLINEFRRWNVSLDIRRHEDRPSARGIVSYAKANRNRKGFQRLTPPLPVTWADLSTTLFATPSAIEIFCDAADILAQFPTELCVAALRPRIIWEPYAKICLPSTRAQHIEACSRVHVFSPNHEELAAFFPQVAGLDGKSAVVFDRALVEAQAAIFLRPGKCVVVRCAEHGCLVLAHEARAVWKPAFYDADAQDRVVDATGAGNAFLGAFAMGWLETGSYVKAVEYGTVAASFVIEQVGLPQLQELAAREMWNDEGVWQRLEEYRSRTCDEYILE